MKHLLLSFFAALSCLSFLPSANAQTAPTSSTEAPDALVKRISNEVLSSIQKDPALQNGDIEKIIKLVDTQVLPYLNFASMTASAVGPGWRQASATQKEQITTEFKQLLVRTYAGAFSQAKDVKLQFRPLRATPEDTEVIVRSSVVPPRGEPIQLDYKLERTPQGWKIKDVNVLGAWLVENYRKSFAAKVNNGGVEALLAYLKQLNTDLAKS